MGVLRFLPKRQAPFLLAIGAGLLLVPAAFASDEGEHQWIAPAGGAFENASNWDKGVPISGDTAVFDLDAAYNVQFNQDHSSLRTHLQQGDVSLDADEWTWTLLSSPFASPSIIVGTVDGGAVLRLRSGTIRSWGLVNLEQGSRLVIDGGHLDLVQSRSLDEHLVGPGSLELRSGTLTARGFVRAAPGERFEQISLGADTLLAVQDLWVGSSAGGSSVSITDGGRLQTRNVTLGSANAFTPVTITGPGSSWTGSRFTANSTAGVQIEVTDGAVLEGTGSSSSLATQSGNTGHMLISGPGTRARFGTIFIGATDGSGAATLVVRDGAVLEASPNIRATGVMRLEDATLDAVSFWRDQGGVFEWISGDISISGPLVGGFKPIGLYSRLLGDDVLIDADKSLAVRNVTRIEAGKSVTLDGGTFKTGWLEVSSGGAFNFDSGTLELTEERLNIGTSSISHTEELAAGPGDVLIAPHGIDVHWSGTLSLAGAEVQAPYILTNGTLVLPAGPFDIPITGWGFGAEIRLDHGGATEFHAPLDMFGSRIHIEADATAIVASELTGSARLSGQGTVIIESPDAIIGTIDPGLSAIVAEGAALSTSAVRARNMDVNGQLIVRNRPSAFGFPNRLETLALGPEGRVDLTNNQLLVVNADLSEIAGWVRSAYAGGTWDGPGIGSSTAAAEEGRAVGYAETDDGVLVGFTWEGDANLDGQVDGEDFLIWQAGFGTMSGATWDKGDFNHDGRIDGDDFLIWQANFGRVAESSAVTPEPVSLGLLSLGGLMLLRGPRA